MSQMAFLEQQQEIAGRLRLDLTDANQAALVKRWINQSQQEIWAKTDWPFALDREIVQAVVDISAGTVSIGSGLLAVTGVLTAWTQNEVGKFIQFEGSNDWYKITVVNSATSLTIEAPYTGTDALSAGTYLIRKVFYSVSSAVEKIIDIRQTVLPAKLILVPYRSFDLFRPNPTTTGSGQIFVVWGYDTSNNWTFSLYPVPSEVYNLEVRLKKKCTSLVLDADVSVIPEKWHSTVMIDGALYRGLEYVRTDSTDRRAEVKRADFLRSLDEAAADAEPDSDYHPIMQNTDRFVGIEKIIEFPGAYDRSR